MGRKFVIVATLFGLLLSLGCASRPPTSALWADSWRWTEGTEPLTLAEFLALPEAEAADRRRAAASHRDRARGARAHGDRVRHLNAATGLAPDDVRLWLELSRECSAAGDVDRALQCVLAAQAALPRVRAEDRRDLRQDVAIARAWLHRDKGQWVMAHAWADSAWSWTPGDRDSQVLRGIALASHGDVPGALNVSKDIELKHPDRFEWRWIRGMAEVARGRYQDAYHWLRDARPVQPWSARFWHDLGAVCEELGDREEAEAYYSYAHDALGLPPGTTTELRVQVPRSGGGRSLELPLWRAYDHLPAAGSRLGWALTAADSALAVPGAPSAEWADMASVLLSTCIRMGVAEDLCRERRALVYAEMGAVELARKDLRRLVDRVGVDGVRSSAALGWYGRMLLENRSWREAVAPLRRAVSLDENDARSWGDLGLALLMSRQEEAGEEALGRALVLDPDLAAAWYNRGLARYFAGRWNEALADLERAHELAPDNEAVAQLLRQAAQRARLNR